MVDYCGLVVEIQPLNCSKLNLCFPSNVNQVVGWGENCLNPCDVFALKVSTAKGGLNVEGCAFSAHAFPWC